MWKGSEQSPKGEYVLNLNNPANGLTCKIRCVILDNNLTPILMHMKKM